MYALRALATHVGWLLVLRRRQVCVGRASRREAVEGNEAQVKKKAQLTKTKTCLLCEEMAEKKNNYCAAHKRAYENLYRHAVKSKEASGPEWVSWCRIFGGAYMEDSRKVVWLRTATGSWLGKSCATTARSVRKVRDAKGRKRPSWT